MLATVLDRAARAGRALRDDRRLAALLDDLVEAGLADRDWRVQAVHEPRWSPVGVTVAVLGPAGEGRLVVKIAHTPAGRGALARERANLAALRADTRVAPLMDRVPRPLAVIGRANDRVYVETALPGVSADRGGADTRAAIDWIRDLHGRTASDRSVDAPLLDAWIDRPLAAIARAVTRDAAQPHALATTRDRFRGMLGGRRLATSWIHGDLWLGNVLVDEAGALTGVVDWDRAGEAELPWHDILHALLAPERLREPASSAVVARAAAGERTWRMDEQAILDAVRDDLADDSPRLESLVALYWLRQTAGTLAGDPGLGRNAAFVAANVRPLLALELLD